MHDSPHFHNFSIFSWFSAIVRLWNQLQTAVRNDEIWIYDIPSMATSNWLSVAQIFSLEEAVYTKNKLIAIIVTRITHQLFMVEFDHIFKISENYWEPPPWSEKHSVKLISVQFLFHIIPFSIKFVKTIKFDVILSCLYTTIDHP